MSASTPITTNSTPRRRPLTSPKGIGTDMSMTFFVQCQIPTRFAYPEHHQIKGLNAETIAVIRFPTPSWLTELEYSALRSDSENDLGAFSLNIPTYNQTINPPEWDGMWFLMSGTAHPYALTWEVDSSDSSDTGNSTQDYTIPVLIVRDQNYQAFTGPIINSGHALLHNESISGMGDTQRKCCGFVQLSTFITPGNSSKPPFRGFHPFQVFVIFPIHSTPWSSLCKKMIERKDTQFQPNTLFTCTGKVAGFLNHKVMVNPPLLAEDRVFIIVPTSWIFLDKSTLRDSLSTIPQPPPTTPSKQPSTHSFDKTQFMSPSKPPTPQSASSISSIQNSSPGHEPSSETIIPKPYAPPPLKRPNSWDTHNDSFNPSKKPNTTQTESWNHAATINNPNTPQKNTIVQPSALPSAPPQPVAYGTVPYETPSVVLPPQFLTENSTRPQRNRHPPKKFTEHGGDVDTTV